MKSMLCMLAMCFTVLAGMSFSQATEVADSTSTGSGGAVAAKVVVKVAQKGAQNGITVINGDYHGDYPLYVASSGTATMRGTSSTNSEITTKSSFSGKISDIESGDSVVIGPSNGRVDLSGTGGSVHVGSGSTVYITNTAAPSTPPSVIHVSLPGGSTMEVPPGTTDLKVVG